MLKAVNVMCELCEDSGHTDCPRCRGTNEGATDFQECQYPGCRNGQVGCECQRDNFIEPEEECL